MSAPTVVYPVEPWSIAETAFDPGIAARSETIFALGNGHLGLRGNVEEGFGDAVRGTYINGFYEEAPIVYGEQAHGYARNHQVMLNIADGKSIRLTVGDDHFDLSTGHIEAYERRLDLRNAVLTRSVRWRSPGGILVELRIRRIVPLSREPLAAIDYEVRVLEGSARLRIASVVNGAARNQAAADDPRIGTHVTGRPLEVIRADAAALDGVVVQRTRTTRQAVACIVSHVVDPTARPTDLATEATADPDGIAFTLSASGVPGSRLHLTKYLAYCTSCECPEDEIVDRSRSAVEGGRSLGFDGLVAEQRAVLDSFWRSADVVIEGDEAVQQGIRFNLLSLLQSVGRNGRTSIAAKGLTGEGYEGHYFWDAEIYVLPLFTYTQPEIARSLVRYRTRLLDKARARAAEMSQRGALYPWRTIGGEETSPYFPAGTAQYHINADIAYAFRRYMNATGDRVLLLESGAPMIFETARLWADLGSYIPARGDRFCINEVTGPDEYTALVNNNLYTNLMAKAHLEYAVELARDLAATAPGPYRRIRAEIGLDDAEIAAWERAAAAMYVPVDPDTGVHPQDDAFFARARWDFAGTPPAKYPLLLHFHPLVIYRHQVLKQPDVVLAQVLLDDWFSTAEKKRDFDFYDALTTGDSSLAPCIQSVAAAELGYRDAAYRYFMQTVRMDLDDVHRNVSNGVHAAAMAGSWISLVYGFAGMRDHAGGLSFAPRLPAAWRRLRFRLRYLDRTLEVDATGDEVTYRLLDGEPVTIRHFGRPISLREGEAARESLVPRLAAVIFDLDGVLADTAEFHYSAWGRVANELGIPFDREVNERLKGVSRLESLAIMLANAGLDLSADERRALADRKNGYFRDLVAALTPADLAPGMEDLLQCLRAEGIRTAIASVSHNAGQVIERLGIAGLVDAVVDPATLARGKPDPEIFFRAADLLGARYEDCAGIEDALAGVAAIRAARMFSVGIGRLPLGADWQVEASEQVTFEELVAQFDRAAARGVAGVGAAGDGGPGGSRG